ncbi:MAG: hypothetical protein JJU31_16030 [Wenzhouxiangella sp.]|nr:hypothetical protein [Wenzhouxiangella sp.]
MATDPSRTPRLDGATLQVVSGPAREPALAAFAFAEAGGAVLRVGLDFLGGDLLCESWLVDRPVASGQADGVSWRQAGELLLLSWDVEDDSTVDPAELADRAYGRLIAQARQQGCPHLLRAWNFMPAINQGEGDSERYRRFCLGRARSLEQVGIDAPGLCAGTAIGGDDPRLRVFILAGRQPGINIENPRQISAYRYPRIYGPRSPSFARATALPQPGGQVLLMISGTASVVGHRTLHEGDLIGQLKEIESNFHSLLSESASRLGRGKLVRFGAGSLLRVYLRRAEDWPATRDFLAQAWPKVPVVALRGDICRSDLLVEIEAVCVG